MGSSMVGCKFSFNSRIWDLNPFLCRIVFVLLASNIIPEVIQVNEYNMFGEYITVIKIPSWVSHLSSRMV